MRYLNIIVIGGLVIYAAYQMYQDAQIGNKDNLLLWSLLLFLGLAILVYRILQLRKSQKDRY